MSGSAAAVNTAAAAAAATVSPEAIAALHQYSACDVSDALLKLHVRGGGFLADLTCFSGRGALLRDPTTLSGGGKVETTSVTIAPVSTVLFIAKDHDDDDDDDDDDTKTDTKLPLPPNNFPTASHWVDTVVPGTLVLIQQPSGQTNAVCGGIMALRMKMLGVVGIIVAGRVRDVDELASTELPIWAQATSTVGSAAACIPWARQVPLTINNHNNNNHINNNNPGVLVEPGDIAVCDPVNGVVVIPRHKLSQLLHLLPTITDADKKVKADVAKGMSVKEAFERHRG